MACNCKPCESRRPWRRPRSRTSDPDGSARDSSGNTKMIDADIARDAGTQGVFALDAATRGHGRFEREENFADFAILVGAAGAAEQGAILMSSAEFLRGDKATHPQTPAIVPGGGFVLAELCRRGRGQIHGEASPDQELAQAHGFALSGANAEVPFFVGLVG